ncbi:hypothetical protein IW140_000684 [Coemansia sp. RSA 1813]|nr:hypothetical protein EV178_000811 [Coemansia sp. RSA 1646]KAJ1773863.1 hypothetical protein LPJ74_000407 [Coemansia sp. RSA 1843]KAJ2092431.1 hypothetical protein IW138_001193 [Coemansia sp. RSA 986]KAJ2217345.1 hypothetical protein EV179_000495 [Coemansia sp. RSA 487]KAJ2572569.1 hypothetical protein IW140_000684 [Coemansia sp. RSA 1813]
MDRKIALPSFREVAGTLPSPSFAHNADSVHTSSTAPRPIPFERAATKSPSGPHSSAGTRYSIHSESSSVATANYNHTGSDTTASAYLQPQQQQQQQQRYFVPQPSSSYPRQTATSNTFLSSSPPIRSREQHQTTSAYSMHSDGAISPYESSAAQQSQPHARNVYGVAQVTTDPIMQQRKSSSLTHSQQSSFMHSPPSSASSRFAPYHMPSAYSLPIAPASGGSGGGLVRTSPSPKFRHEGSGNNNCDFSVSRAAAAISSVALSSPISPTVHAPPATTAQHKQRAAFPAKIMPPSFQQNEQRQIPMHSHPPHYISPGHPAPGGRPVSVPSTSGTSVAPISIPPPLTLAHSPSSPPAMSSMSLTQQRMDHHSLSEHIEQDDAEDDAFDCYDDTSQPQGADGPIMTTAKIRTIHKLAERRRRREMKNLFDTLRKRLPIDKSIRLSKWEVLKKAIEVISTQEAEIHMLRLHINAATKNNNTYKESVT